MSFEPEPGQRYDMPVAFGPSVAPPVSEGFEAYVTSVTYTTTKDAVAPLLPRWFEPSDRQQLTLSYTRMLNVDWMGGRDYNIVNVNANVVCTAGPEPLAGRYTLAIWETDCAPILSGREYMGSPKLMANIPDADTFADRFSIRCREYDTELIRVEIDSMRDLTPEQLAPITESGENTMAFNWKYVPGLGDEPDVSYPTALYMSLPFDRGRRGEGTITFGDPTDTEAPYSARIIRYLKTVPLLDHVGTLSLHSPYSHLYRDRTRRLDV